MAASTTPSRKKSLTWLVPASLGAGALALSLVTGSLGAFTAQIQNDKNTAGAGALTMQETWTPGGGQPAVVCNSGGGSGNTATCSTINKYGGKTTMAPGEVSTVDITLKNTGSINATGATLTPGACVATPTPATGVGDLCTKMQIAITQGGTSIFTGTPNELTAKGPITLTAPASGASVAYKITATLPTTVDNSFAGTAISQPLTWTYNA